MQLDITQAKKVFFVGIGGIGISAIARMFLQEGKHVLGSDVSEGEVVRELRDAGASIVLGQGIELIPADVDLIVYTIAIEKYDPDFFAALKAKTIPVLSYPEMLHVVTSGKYTIAVSGTHGKTTTTAMIAHAMKQLNQDPTVIVGSLMIDEKSNFIAGASQYFVVEACEYRRSFLNINPTILVITNIEEDHLDYYKDLNDIISAFRELAMKVPKEGYIVCDPSHAAVRAVIDGCDAQVIDYTTLAHKRALRIPGIHNQANAAASAAVLATLHLAPADVDAALGTFKGTWRRFQFIGTHPHGFAMYDDYAHHPTEIIATLEGFREIYPYGEKKITVIFQPHLYSRTKSLLAEFADAFKGADKVIILPIYAAREENDGSISSEILAERIRATGVDASALDFEAAAEFVATSTLEAHDVVVTMGAGEAFKVLPEVVVQ